MLRISIWLSLLVTAIFPAAAQYGATPPDSAAALRDSLSRQRAAIEIQREASRKQAQLIHPEPLLASDPPSEPATPECEPIADATVNPIIESAAKANSLETDLLRAVIRQESQFYPCAVSEKGARGLMQLMPATMEQFKVSDAFDPKQSIDAGAKYLKQLYEKYKGKLDLVLGAYNAGPAAVDEAHGVPDIPETRSYVKSILESLSKKP